MSYLFLPGLGDYVSTPDAASLDITGDLDLRAAVELADWTPVAAQLLISKGTSQASAGGYIFWVDTTGTLTLRWSDGSSFFTKTSTVAVGASDKTLLLVRATLDVNNGASGNDVKFWTKTSTPANAVADLADNAGWTQLGTTVTTAGTTSIAANTREVRIGAHWDGGSPVAGRLYAAQIRNGIDGTVVANPDFTTPSVTTTSFADSTGKTWTLQGDATFLVAYTGTPTYLDLVGNNWAETPDAAALDITGDIDLRAVVEMDDWTPDDIQRFVSKWGPNQQSYGLEIRGDGKLYLVWDTDGTGSTNASPSTVAVGAADGSLLGVRATRVGGTSTFYTKTVTEDWAHEDAASDQGWTQLGATGVATGSFFAGTAPLRVGVREEADGSLAGFVKGKLYAACVKSGAGGTRVAWPNFSNNPTDPFTDLPGREWTLDEAPVHNPIALTSGTDAGVSTKQTASITPDADELVLIDVWSRVASGTPNIPTASGNGITYVVEETVTFDGGLRRLTRLRGMDDAPTAGVVTLDWAGQSQAAIQWAIAQFGNVNTGGQNGSVACRNSESDSGSGTGALVTLPQIQNARNAVFSAAAFADDATITPGSGFTELTDAAASDASGQMQTQYQIGRDRTADATGPNAAWGMIATEIRVTGGSITTDALTSGTATPNPTVTTASVTPAADSLIKLSILNSKASNADAPTSVEGFGLTWTQDFTESFGTSDTHRLSVYYAMGSAPTPGTVTITFPSNQTAAEWSLVEFGNVDTTVEGGSSAIIQSDSSGGGTGSQTSLTTTLAAFEDANNDAYGALAVDADNDVTPGTGFSQLHEVRNATNTQTLFTEVKVNDNTVDASWTTSTPAILYASEIEHLDPADVPPPPDPDDGDDDVPAPFQSGTPTLRLRSVTEHADHTVRLVTTRQRADFDAEFVTDPDDANLTVRVVTDTDDADMFVYEVST